MTKVDEAISELIMAKKIESEQIRHDAQKRLITIELDLVTTTEHYEITTRKADIKSAIMRAIRFNQQRLKERDQASLNF